MCKNIKKINQKTNTTSTIRHIGHLSSKLNFKNEVRHNLTHKSLTNASTKDILTAFIS